MDEQYYRDLLSAYLDNELTPEERAMVEDHLRENPESRRLLEELRRVDGLVESHSGLDESDYWEKSAQKIEQRLGLSDTQVTDLRPARRSGSGIAWKVVASVAAVLVLAFIGFHESDILNDNGVRHAPKNRESVATPSAPMLPPVVHPVDVPAESSSEPGAEEVDREDVPTQDEVTQGTAKEAEVPRRSARSAVQNSVAGQLEESSDTANKPSGDVLPPAPAPTIPGLKDDRGVTLSKERFDDIALTVDASHTEEALKGKRQEVSAAAKDKLQAADADSNYKREAQRRITVEGGGPGTESVQPTEDSRLFDAEGAKKLVAEELVRWQNKRDSLRVAMGGQPYAGRRVQKDSIKPEEDTTSHGTKIGMPAPVTQGFAESTERRSGKAMSDTPGVRAGTSHFRTALLEAWYNVCRLTPDSTERADGMAYIRSEAASRDASLAQQARRYLDQLSR